MALPEKQFFSLEEIARRWACDVSGILSYGLRQESMAAAKGGRDREAGAILRMHALVPSACCDWQTIEPIGMPDAKVPNEYRPTFEPCLPEIPAIFVSDLMARGVAQLRYGYFQDQFGVMHRGELVEPGTLGHPLAVQVKDVVVTRGNRDEFERAHKIGVASAEVQRREGGDIHPRTKNNYLRLIMALATTAVKDFDPRKPYEAASGIRETAEIDIDEKTLASYVSEAYELQTKERA